MKKTQKPKPKRVTKKKGKQIEPQEEAEDLKYDYNYDDIVRMSKAADCMAQGDLLNRSIKRKQNWALMPAYGYYSFLYEQNIINTTTLRIGGRGNQLPQISGVFG